MLGGLFTIISNTNFKFNIDGLMLDDGKNVRYLDPTPEYLMKVALSGITSTEDIVGEVDTDVFSSCIQLQRQEGEGTSTLFGRSMSNRFLCDEPRNDNFMEYYLRLATARS